jgi:hypothetical protein
MFTRGFGSLDQNLAPIRSSWPPHALMTINFGLLTAIAGSFRVSERQRMGFRKRE